ncbi:MAG: alkaline phosphatase [Parashewanella sp.]
MNITRTLKRLALASIIFPVICNAASVSSIQSAQSVLAPKNIIIMIGDGMGPAYTTAYRLYKDDPTTAKIEPTIFDEILVGMARTSPARMSGYVTDSAAAATALSSGVKTYNGAIGKDAHKHDVTTLLERAKTQGKAIGVAVTSQVNHATPAAFLAHNDSRKNYEQIAQAYLHSDADVILGGGQKYFSKSLINKFESKGYQYVSQFDHLNQVKSGKVLGLFAKVQLPWAVDNPDAHQLSTMTEKALEVLSQSDKGFVLLVEGSLIDWAGHYNDMVSAMGEMDEFARTVMIVRQFVKQHPDTLMVVTADHETGGLTVGAGNRKRWKPEVLRKIHNSPTAIVDELSYAFDWQLSLVEQLGFQPKKKEMAKLVTVYEDKTKLAFAISELINKYSLTGWTSDDHTAVDVQVFAAGQGAEKFIGSQENTDIANKLADMLK